MTNENSLSDLLFTARTAAAEMRTIAAEPESDLDDTLTAVLSVAELRSVLAEVLADLQAHAVDLMRDADTKTYDVPDIGRFERMGSRERKSWDKEALLSAVLDSRMPVDPDTGEVDDADQTPLSRVLHVFNLPAPRTTALRERGIDPDEFCESTFKGESLRLPPFKESV